jgi:DNA-directed RNA polymerase subunit alpha
MIKVAGKEPLVESVRVTPDYGKFVLEPLPHGFGTTLGTALRRVLLNSVPGVAITAARIDGVAHEFTTLPHVQEDMTELILNLKEVAFQATQPGLLAVEGGERFAARIQAEGIGEVTAADVVIEKGDIEVVNPDLHLASLTHDEARLLLDLTIETGTGYVPADKHDVSQMGLGVIPVDSLFTPVTRVNHVVESTRVASATDLDRLVLEIWTNAAMTPVDALSAAARILDGYFRLFFDFRGEPTDDAPGRGSRHDGAGRSEAMDAKIEELDFSVRTYNCLKKEHIDTIGELIQLSEKALLEIRNLGTKSLNEIKDKLAERALKLAADEG